MLKLKVLVVPMMLMALIGGIVSHVRAADASTQYAAVLSVKRMCCAKESVPAIRELSKVPGVGRVSVDYKARTLSIAPTQVAPSPKAIWEAAERVKIEPVRLTIRSNVYTSKPTQ